MTLPPPEHRLTKKKKKKHLLNITAHCLKFHFYTELFTNPTNNKPYFLADTTLSDARFLASSRQHESAVL